MTDQPAQEPTMEEILASIRRIISEDEAPAQTPAAATPEPEPEPETQAEPAPAEAIFAEPAAPADEPAPETPAAEEDVLELTELYEAPASETIGDLEVVEPVAEPVAAPNVEEKAPSYDALVGESAAASAASAFAGLAASFKKPDAPAGAPSGDLSFVSGNTVEAIVAEMMRPMLKAWLDANLPGIVEAAVRKEVERIARSA